MQHLTAQDQLATFLGNDLSRYALEGPLLIHDTLLPLHTCAPLCPLSLNLTALGRDQSLSQDVNLLTDHTLLVDP